MAASDAVVWLAVIFSMARYAKGEMQRISDEQDEKVGLLLTLYRDAPTYSASWLGHEALP